MPLLARPSRPQGEGPFPALVDIHGGAWASGDRLNNAPLDDVAQLAGLPGKIGMAGGAVWEQYRGGGIERIRNYCETDVLNTFLVYLRFELIRGRLTPTEYETECSRVREYLEKEGKPHFSEFLGNWK